jgi:hypothetical protein
MADKKKKIKQMARLLPAVMMAGAMTIPSGAGLHQQELQNLVNRAEATQSGTKVLDSQANWQAETLVNSPQQSWGQITWGQVTWAQAGGGPRQDF